MIKISVAMGLFFFFSATGLTSTAMAAENDYYLEIRWDGNDPIWTKLILLNRGRKAVDIQSITFNSREDCVTVPYELGTIMSQSRSQDAQILAMLAMFIKYLFIDKTDQVVQGVEALPSLNLQVGDRVPIVSPSGCGSIIRANVETEQGEFEIEFETPFNG